MKQKSTNPHIGTRFEDFLRADGRLDEATTLAIKRVLAYQLTEAMTRAKVSQAELARRMRTSRAVIRRLLDKDDPSVTLSTMPKAASALGKSLTLNLAA